jgi:hypothetical protein
MQVQIKTAHGFEGPAIQYTGDRWLSCRCDLMVVSCCRGSPMVASFNCQNSLRG